MREFAALVAAIDETNRTNEKVAAMARYFAVAPPADAAWAVHFLIGRRPKRLVKAPLLWAWAVESADIPAWLFMQCYDAVGDLAETIAAVLPDARSPVSAGSAGAGVEAAPEGEEELLPTCGSLAHWIENRLLPLGQLTESDQAAALKGAWAELDRNERFVFNKLITGAFRVGVSQDLVVRALSQVSGIPVATVSHRLMGQWDPTAAFFLGLVGPDSGDADISRPYPFCLAHPLDSDPSKLGDIDRWRVEWKWDGIRAQLIRREGRSFVWSRGEDLITERFPEIERVCSRLPDGTVLDGEILAWQAGRPLKFLDLQQRIGRKVLTKRIIEKIPVVAVVFDLLEWRGEDIRERPLDERRAILERVVALASSGAESDANVDPRPIATSPESPLLLSPAVHADSWDELAELRREARSRGVEGFMIKARDASYLGGRKKGIWWKWKIDPMTADCVLIYAQRGSGKRASLYTDYTFGVWKEGELVPLAKAYSGLTDEEIRRVDNFVRRNTLEKFGPVRTVKPELVFELGFESIQLSSRHKSGIAVRFPRILRWRHDKTPDQADTLESVKAILQQHEAQSAKTDLPPT